eukprot:6350715-Ditylum_brightwellii.AAC.2
MTNNPQVALMGYTCSLQFEWAYIQWAIKVEEHVFKSVEAAIKSSLLPALFDAREIPLTTVILHHSQLEWEA